MTVRLGTVSFDDVTRREALAMIDALVAAGKPTQVCTPNADHVVRCESDREFRNVIERAALVVPDGMGVIYGSRVAGTPLQQNVGGRLLVSALAQREHRIYFLGGSSEDVVRRAIARLRDDVPETRVVGWYVPPFAGKFSERQVQSMVERIREARPDVLFVCLGTPKQELLIGRHLDEFGVPVAIGVGAALDILGGSVPAPPAWMTAVGLEWVVKLLHSPHLMWRRYLVNGPRFVLIALRMRRQRRTEASRAG